MTARPIPANTGWGVIVSGWRRRAGLLGVAALAASLAGAVFDTGRFFEAYLVGFALVLGAGLGTTALLMLHHLVGGGWGRVSRRILEAGSRTLPLVALAFLPIAAGAFSLYEWTRAEEVIRDPVLEHKSAYLNYGFFVARAAVFFGVWLAGARLIDRWAESADAGSGGLDRLQKACAAGILIYVLTMSFAAIDWVMSLSPHWYSTIFGLLTISGQVLTALSVTSIAVVAFSSLGPLNEVVTSRHLHDLGNLILTFVMLWAYLSFSQFLLIWSANLPEEIPYYLVRTAAGWEWAAGLLIVFHFAVPFALLLSRRMKRTGRTLASIAAALVVMRWLDLYWIIVPAVRGTARLHWLDVTTPVALASLWAWSFLGELPRRGLVAPQPAGGRARTAEPATGET